MAIIHANNISQIKYIIDDVLQNKKETNKIYKILNNFNITTISFYYNPKPKSCVFLLNDIVKIKIINMNGRSKNNYHINLTDLINKKTDILISRGHYNINYKWKRLDDTIELNGGFTNNLDYKEMTFYSSLFVSNIDNNGEKITFNIRNRGEDELNINRLYNVLKEKLELKDDNMDIKEKEQNNISISKYKYLNAKLKWRYENSDKKVIHIKLDIDDIEDALPYEWFVERRHIPGTKNKYYYDAYGILTGMNGNIIKRCKLTSFLRNKYESRIGPIANLKRIKMPKVIYKNNEEILVGHLNYCRTNLMPGNSQFPNKDKKNMQDYINKYENDINIPNIMKNNGICNDTYPVQNIPHKIKEGNWGNYIENAI